MKYLVPICALLTVSCTGVVDGQDQGGQTPPVDMPVNMGTAGTTSQTPMTTPAGAPFLVKNKEPELISFQMRLRRIASALGVDVGHPMFAEMYKNNLKLGDYDYANGAQPDFSWNANRIATWMTALKPICDSAEMKAKFPALPENLPQLARAAWGHLPAAEDTAEYTAAIAESALDAATVYQSTCIAVFSSAEFVYR
ncbi:MAG TPA: hypothetical protein VJN18_15765 [Polyangiaceae bacterium]|nr:hypothetical protein [Polyangiaceae bacterium]